MILCSCFAITETDIEAEISAGARTEQQIGEQCGAGTDCGGCSDTIRAMLDRPTPDRANLSLAIA